MKVGEQFEVTNHDLVKGLEKRVVELDIEGKRVTARVISIGSNTATLRVVPERTKE